MTLLLLLTGTASAAATPVSKSGRVATTVTQATIEQAVSP